jgi:hypothetical protein
MRRRAGSGPSFPRLRDPAHIDGRRLSQSRRSVGHTPLLSSWANCSSGRSGGKARFPRAGLEICMASKSPGARKAPPLPLTFHVSGVSVSAQAVVSTLRDCCGQLLPHDEMRSHANRPASCDRSDRAAQVLR